MEHTITEQNDRNENIDILRAICAFLVVYLHLGCPFGGIYVETITRIAVPFFALTSGYFITNTNKIRHSIFKNIKLLIFTEFVYVLSYLVLKQYDIFYLIASERLKSLIDIGLLLHFKIWAAGWFLLSLIYAQIVMLIIMKHQDKFNERIILVICIVLILFFWIAPRTLLLKNLYSCSNGIRLFPFVFIGKMLKKVKDKILKLQKLFVIFVGVSFIASILERYLLNRIVGDQVFFFIYLGTIPMVVSIFCLAICLPKINAPLLAFIGKKLSMFIYCYHSLIGGVLRRHDNTFATFRICIITVVISFLIRCVITMYNKIKSKIKI